MPNPTPDYDYFAGRGSGAPAPGAPRVGSTAGAPATNQFGTPTNQFGSVPSATTNQFGTPANQFGAPAGGPTTNQFGTPTNQFGTPTNQFGTPVSQPFGGAPGQFGQPAAPAPSPSARNTTRIPIRALLGVGGLIAVVIMGAITGTGRFGFLAGDVDLPATLNGQPQMELPEGVSGVLDQEFQGLSGLDPDDYEIGMYGTAGSPETGLIVLAVREKYAMFADDGIAGTVRVGDGECLASNQGVPYSICTSHGSRSTSAVISYSPMADQNQLQKMASDVRKDM